MSVVEMLLTIFCSVLASSGLWSIIMYILQKKDKDDPKTKMILGLGHDRIMSLGTYYLDRHQQNGSGITSDEYENLHDYLYEPYKALGGNGSARRVIDEVKKLPIINHQS